jgi:hypothetical protein
MSDATDINSLPTNPALGSADSMPNIVFAQNEKITNNIEHINKSREDELRTYSQGPANQNQSNSGVSNGMPTALDQTLINKLITGIQQASASGLTNLPSSHIPMDTNAISSDPQTRPNYIPPSSTNDYIRDSTSNDDLLKYHTRRQNKQDSLDVMYDELQIPILIGIIYFMFQLPFFRKHLFAFLPSLFNKDGNPKLSGYAFNSLLFAVLFYIIKKILNYLTDI